MEDLDKYYSKANKKDQKILKKKKKQKKKQSKSFKEMEQNVDASIIETKRRQLKDYQEKVQELEYLLSKDDLKDNEFKLLTKQHRILKHKIKELKDSLEDDSVFSWIMLLVLLLGMGFIFVSKYNEEFYSDWDFSLEHDFYKSLELERGATRKDVKRAYRDLMKRYHPDRNPNCEDCARKIYRIQQAYETLGNAAKKELYDQNNGAFQTIQSKATELTTGNFQRCTDSVDLVGVFQIYDSSQRSQNFGSFYEDMLGRLEYIDFFRVHSKAQGKLLGKLPYGSPILPFVYFTNRLQGTSDILEYDEMGYRNPTRDLVKSLLRFIPKNYVKMSESESLERANNAGPARRDEFDFVVDFDDINKKSPEIKLRLLYYIYVFKVYFGKRSLLVDTSAASQKRALSLQMKDNSKSIQLSLKTLKLKDALNVALKVYFLEYILSQSGPESMTKDEYLRMCRSKLAQTAQTRCFLLFRDNESSRAIHEEANARNRRLRAKISGDKWSRAKTDEILSSQVDLVWLVDTEKTQFVFAKNLRELIGRKLLQKQRAQEFSEESGEKKVDESAVERGLERWTKPALVYAHSRDNDVLIEPVWAEVEDTLEDLLNSKMDFEKVFPEVALEDALLRRNETYLTLFFKCLRQNLFKFDVVYWGLIAMVVVLHWKFGFSTKMALGVFFVAVLGLSLNQFRLIVA